MNLEEFAKPMAAICSHSLVAPGRPLHWTIIANPTAGGFTIKSRWKQHSAALKLYMEKAEANPLREDAGPSKTALEADQSRGSLGRLGLTLTQGPGTAGKIVKALLEEASSTRSGGNAPFHLLITAGGDGTSLEALTVLYTAPAALRSNFAVLRLPMGTGNDGADARELDGVLDRLIHPSTVEYARALRLTTASGKGPFMAFNILSVGLDAFVTHMTNKMKGKLPGDSYKLWVDIASLLYDRLYKVGHMDVRAFDEAGRQVEDFGEKVLLLAVGASGHRTYGSNKRILPDERNVCVVQQMSLFRKVALKGLFTTGGHIHKPESKPFNAHRVEFRGENPILAQMDGEAVLLKPEDFPAAIELTELAIPVLKLGERD
ncbi:diacylglycerol kinase [Treponema primitia ZAS-2]|uniref:Diacylglycerol kinase n=1 Tax=Treponema primitia (strain ATCC BAA-887 / DSM 12427 / ZAS-2) TaxID=545694 RepID=F5YQX7_TREPZ|nr:diacylglycerol kinase family protein [Treponema primitia]AEF86375.1 diacylglycerol kinase [Treponema primitia ZAS-2]